MFFFIIAGYKPAEFDLYHTQICPYKKNRPFRICFIVPKGLEPLLPA